jgi:hypothetical protein
LFVNGTGPTDFNDSALAAFKGFGSTPAATPPSFDFKVSTAGGSGGSVRLVVRFSDGGRGELRPVTLQAGQWTHVDGSQPDWDTSGGTCGSRSSQTYAQVLACHPGATVTSIQVINDSGWLHPGGFQVLVDNVSYGGETVSDVPPPVLGETIIATQFRGDVVLSVPGAAASSAARASAVGGPAIANLHGAAPVPVDTVINSVAGRVNLVSARGSGRTQSGNFFGGEFKLNQSRKRKRKGLTTLTLRGRLGCGASSSSHASAASDERAEASRRRRRRLWGSGRGRFRTRARSSSATVRGTKWLTVDRCDGTLTIVRTGVVAVRDFRLKKTIILNAGGRYLARRR